LFVRADMMQISRYKEAISGFQGEVMRATENEPVQFASGKVHMEIILTSLGSKDADLSQALMRAAMIGNTSAVAALLDHGVDVNARDENGRTALMEAAFGGHEETVRVLIERGADVNACDRDGWTALMEGASKGRLNVVRMILEAGADVSARNKNGWSALKASARSSSRMLKLLKEAGAEL
jgi:ankyrin repeat protein